MNSSGLLRVLGSVFGLAIAVGATIGGGILRTPGDIAARLPSATWYLGVWMFGGVNAVLGATAYSELGTMIPRSGGIYTYAQRAMGDVAGFVVGFMDWLNWSISSAALILLVGEYLAGFLSGVQGHTTLTGFAVFLGVVVLQWRGVVWSERFQEVTSAMKAIALLALVALAFVLTHGPAHAAPRGVYTASLAFPHGAALLTAVATSVQATVFTYDSYYIVAYCGEELRDPARQIPRSMFRSLLLIVGIYLLANAAYLRMVPVSRIAGNPFVGATIATMLFGPHGDALIRALMLVSLIGTVNAQMMAAPRILFAMGRDGLLPSGTTRVNAGGTPSVAMVLSATCVAVFLFSGSFNAAIAVDSIVIVFGYVMVFLSLFVLRWREPNAPRPYRATAYPVVPGLALLLAVLILGTLVVTDFHDALLTGALLLASVPGALLRRITPQPQREG